MSQQSSSSSSSFSSLDSDNDVSERPIDDLLGSLVQYLEKIEHCLEILDHNPNVLSTLPDLRRLFIDAHNEIKVYEAENALPNERPSLVRQSTLNQVRPSAGQTKRKLETGDADSKPDSSVENSSKKDLHHGLAQ